MKSLDEESANILKNYQGNVMTKGGKLEGWQVEKLGDVCEVFADGDWIESKDHPQKVFV